jgi:lysophospholipase L1-like esterase
MKRKHGCIVAALALFALVMAGFETSSPGDDSLTIVALGDSTTAGTPGFRSPREAPPEGSGDPESQYAHWILERHPEWRVLNRGIAGERSDQILKRFESDVSAQNPDMVIILAGVNDLYQGYAPEWIESQLERMYQLAAEAGIQVVTCSILPYDGAGPAVLKKMREVNDWIRTRSTELGLNYCDTYSAAEDSSRPGKLSGTADGLHPDVEGYRKIGEAITETLEKLVPS